jgi:hypothetical protein
MLQTNRSKRNNHKPRKAVDTESKIYSSAQIAKLLVSKCIPELERRGYVFTGKNRTAGKVYPGLLSRTSLWCRNGNTVHGLEIKVNQTAFNSKGEPNHKNCPNQYKDVLGSVHMQRISPPFETKGLELRSSMFHYDLVKGEEEETALGHEHDDRIAALEKYGIKTYLSTHLLLDDEVANFVSWWLGH